MCPWVFLSKVQQSQGPGSAVVDEALPAGHPLVLALGTPLDGIPGPLVTSCHRELAGRLKREDVDFFIDGWDFLIFQWSIDSIIKNHLRWSSQTHFKSRFALISSIFQCEQEVTPRIFDLSRFLWPVINDAERPFSAEDSSDWPVMLTDLVNIMDASWSKNQPLARFHRNGWSMLVISRIRNESIFSLFSIYRPLKGKSLKGNILDIL